MARQEKCGGDKLPSPNTDRRPPTLCYEYAFSVVMCHVAALVAGLACRGRGWHFAFL